MAGENPSSIVEISEYGIPILTFLLGFFASRFTMTKKESADNKAALLDRSSLLTEARSEAFERFSAALATYAERTSNPTFQDFYSIATAGESYFTQLGRICDAIIAKQLDQSSATNTHYPVVKDAVERVLPAFFDTLRDIAKRNAIPYSGVLRREDYLSIYNVYDDLIANNTT